MSPLRTPLVLLPTPVHRLDRMSDRLGIDLWIKRDDLTGFAFGGNKGRKLEYLTHRLDGAEVVVTCGSTQSNFVRQLAAVCAVRGIEFHAVLMDRPFPEGHARPEGPSAESGGNLALDKVLGALIHRVPDGGWSLLEGAAAQLHEELTARGKNSVLIPLGGSTPEGCFAFYQAGCELQAQLSGVDWVVTASSSGSTQTGLAMAFRGTATRVLGISADPEPEIAMDLAALSRSLAPFVGQSAGMEPGEFDFRLEWVGPGYGVPSEAGLAAIEFLARTEGVFLDPIYTGKAFAGLMDLAQDGAVQGRVVFWHTGGLPALLAH